MKAKLQWFFKTFIWLAVLMFIIDLTTKLVILYNTVEGYDKVLIPYFLSITVVYNQKAAFGMGFTDPNLNRWMYVVIAILGSAGLITYYVLKFKKNGLYVKACLMLMTSGAIGNLVDRLFYAKSGYAVVDWINFFTFEGSPWVWNFNIADSCIVVGTIMLIVYLIVEEVKEYKKQKAEKPVEEAKILSKEEMERLEKEKKNKKKD